MTIQNALERIRKSKLPFKARLEARVIELCAAFDEDYGPAQPSSTSISDMIGFFEAGALEYYSITLTPAGDWFVEWKLPNNRDVSIEFLSNGKARFLLASPNPRHGQEEVYVTGMTTSDSLADGLPPLNPWNLLAAA